MDTLMYQSAPPAQPERGAGYTASVDLIIGIDKTTELTSEVWSDRLESHSTHSMREASVA